MNNWNWDISSTDYLERTIKRCKENKILLPTFNQLKHPNTIPIEIQEKLKKIGLQEVHPLNLFRINWNNNHTDGSFNSALLSVHSIAILPEEMSNERFEWLKEIGSEVYATPGCESNVKEIYDKCHELEAESDEYLVFNQFD